MSMGFITDPNSPYNKARAAKATQVDKKAVVQKQEADLQSQIHTLKIDIATQKRNIATAEANKAQYPGNPAFQIIINNCRKRITDDQNQIKKLQDKLNSLKGNPAKVIKKKKPPAGVVPPEEPMQYNVPAVKETYFTSRPEFLLELQNSVKHGSTVSGSGATVPVFHALVDLWINGKSSKGMICTWSQTNSYYVDASTANVMQFSSATTVESGTDKKLAVFPPHGFRFQYNPGSVSMSYSGVSAVDPNFEASGKDKFNLVGTGVTQSVVSFQLLINRMSDMKYYWREGERDASGAPTTPGTLKVPAKDVYGIDVPVNDQKAIYNMGTMYDLEFLLRAIMGYSSKSYLRDYSFFKDGGTADMGYIGARPVELHLGKNLRYLVFINGISVEHAIFDNRMVPLFTNVRLDCYRLPDYQDVNAWDRATKATASTNTNG